MKKLKHISLFILMLFGFVVITATSVKAEPVSHLVISEIKTSGGTGKATDEFVELYNPTDTAISLAGWRLDKKTSGGSPYPLVDNFGDLSVQPHGYLLVAHPVGYLGTAFPDKFFTTTNSISDNNTVIIYNSDGMEVDKVGFGTAGDFEIKSAPNPSDNKSLERKAGISSTAETMAESGSDYFSGNSEDTSDNSFDFILKNIPEPQNSLNEPEYLLASQPPANPPPVVVIPPTISYSKEISISEIFPNPSGSDDGEFIELYNFGSIPVDLNGWKLGDSSSRLFIINGVNVDQTVIAPGGYLAVMKEVSGISLNNTGDTAKLFFPDGNLANSVEYKVSYEAKTYAFISGIWQWTDQPTPGQVNVLASKNVAPVAEFEVETSSFKVGQEIKFDASASGDADGDKLEYIWDFGDGVIPSGKKTSHVYKKPGEQLIRLLVKDGQGGEDEQEIKIVVSDFDFSPALVINELFPACTGPDQECEFIEIFNPEKRDVSLDGWVLSDGKSKFKFTEQQAVPTEGYLLVKYKQSKITLNNQGDKVYLIDPAGKILNGVEYQKAKDGYSFARTADSRGWQWTARPTPGEPNQFVEEELASDSATDIEAVAGDSKTAETSATPVSLDLIQVDEGYLGRVVQVSARVESVSGSNIYLTDPEGNTLRVYIQKASGIGKTDIKKGDQVKITGILDKTEAGLRLLPKKQADIVIKPVGQVLGAETKKEIIELPVDEKTNSIKPSLIISVGLIIAAVIFLVVKKMRKDAERNQGNA